MKSRRCIMHERRWADGSPLGTPYPPLPLAALRLYIRTFWLLTAKCGAISAWGGLNVAERYYLMCESSASHPPRQKKLCDYDNVHAGVPVFHQRPSRLTLVLISGADTEAKRRILKRITQFFLKKKNLSVMPSILLSDKMK